MNRQRSRRKNCIDDITFIGPAFVLYTILFLIPMILSIVYSFTDWDGIQKTINFVGFENYINALKNDERFLNAMKFTFVFTFWGFIGVNVIGLATALLLNLNLKVKGLVRTLVYIPNVVSLIAVGILWRFMYREVLPEIGEKLGIAFLQMNFLMNVKGIVYVVLVPAIWQSIGFAMLIYLAGLQGVPQELEECMILDGANPVQRFCNLTVVYLIPSFITCIFSVTTGALKVYDIIVALTNGGPVRASVSMALHIHQEGLNSNQYGAGSAKAVIFSVIIMAITLTQFLYLKKREVEV